MEQSLLTRLRAALEAQDVAGFEALLDPSCRWGAPDDAAPGCVNRRQVLNWYRRRFVEGVRAEVTEMAANGDRILVGLLVSGRPGTTGNDDPVPRWQVLTVQGDLVTDIRGFDDRAEAARRVGVA